MLTRRNVLSAGAGAGIAPLLSQLLTMPVAAAADSVAPVLTRGAPVGDAADHCPMCAASLRAGQIPGAP